MGTDRAKIAGLMDRAASGCDEAFGAVADAVQDDLFRFALSQGLNRTDAAEAVQEALLRAFGRRGDWRPGTDAVAWLRQFALNVAREMHRRNARHRPDRLRAGLAEKAAQAGDADEEYVERLLAAMELLPPRQREAVGCRYLSQLSTRETADVMGCAEGTVKATLSAALDFLREKLGSST